MESLSIEEIELQPRYVTWITEASRMHGSPPF